ncbi:DUF5994 family protein [Streptomyces sp. NBC_01304]|uniref:DUF5994 family protein n=1 Tax=Streptomyces sp. NBC_01304 TaxID=2903818 RepID=UPI002E0D81B5
MRRAATGAGAADALRLPARGVRGHGRRPTDRSSRVPNRRDGGCAGSRRRRAGPAATGRWPRPHTIRLFSHDTVRWDLLVVPPQSKAGAAARLMAAAADPALRLTGTALMATVGPTS